MFKNSNGFSDLSFFIIYVRLPIYKYLKSESLFLYLIPLHAYELNFALHNSIK